MIEAHLRANNMFVDYSEVRSLLVNFNCNMVWWISTCDVILIYIISAISRKSILILLGARPFRRGTLHIRAKEVCFYVVLPVQCPTVVFSCIMLSCLSKEHEAYQII
jgi:hypothetical protein